MFSDIADLMKRFAELGAIRAFCKPLAENDNSKQQIYLGGNFDVVQMFPFENVEATSNGKDSTYKAKLNFVWVSSDKTDLAAGAQLILYPQYPEVRLSGFLRGCKHAPNELLRPIPASQRRFNNGPDGRILFLELPATEKRWLTLPRRKAALHKSFDDGRLKARFLKKAFSSICHCLGATQNLFFLRAWQRSGKSVGINLCA